MAEQKDLTGALFKNKRKVKDSHPDYTGILMVDGVEYWMSAWINTPKSGGDKYMSINLTEKEQQLTPASKPQQNFEDGDIPF